jgi:hypothetical protein
MNPDWPLIICNLMKATATGLGDIAWYCEVSESEVERWADGEAAPSYTQGWGLLLAYLANVGPFIPKASVCSDSAKD